MISIVIVNWNTRDFLVQCLDSIYKTQGQSPSEIIVVDNDSKDGSAQAVEELFPEVILIRSGKNLGYAAGNNLGIARATGDLVLTLNPDTELQTHTLSVATEVLLSDEKCGCAAVQLRGHENEIQASVRGFPTFWGIFGDVSGMGKLYKGTVLDSYRLTAFDYEKDQIAPQPMGTFLLFKRDTLPDPHTPFDENFPIFFNEVDLLFRMQRAGYHTRFSAKTFVKHLGGASTRQVKKKMIWESHRSLVRYLRKHEGTGLASVGVSLVAVAAYLAAFIRSKGYDVGFRT